MKTTGPTMNRLRLDGAMRTHPGAVRPLNEDNVSYLAPPNGDQAARGSLILVADGMGGHAAGEVASALAVETVSRAYSEANGPIPQMLASAFRAANRAIHAWADNNPECKGMGTTCTALALRDDQAWLAHVGDSRAYVVRDGVMTQLSEDQTLVAQLVREGKLTPEQAHNSPVSNVILQALGSNPEITPAIWSEPLRVVAGDIFILCTDGLHGVVTDAAIAKQVGQLPPDEACESLIELAMAAGAPDNVSVGVFRVVADTEASNGGKSEEIPGTTRRMKRLDDRSDDAESYSQSSAQTRRLRFGG